MDPRAYNKIFPEEISSVDTFIKKQNNFNNNMIPANIRGSTTTVDLPTEAVDVDERPIEEKRYESQNEESVEQPSSKENTKTKKKRKTDSQVQNNYNNQESNKKVAPPNENVVNQNATEAKKLF